MGLNSSSRPDTPQTVVESDEEMDDEDGKDRENQPSTSSTSARTPSTANPQGVKSRTGKKKTVTSDTDILAQLNERVTETKKLQNRIDELVQSADNPRTAWANWMGTMFPLIHDDLWEQYLRQSFDSLLWYYSESNRIRRQREQVSNPTSYAPVQQRVCGEQRQSRGGVPLINMETSQPQYGQQQQTQSTPRSSTNSFHLSSFLNSLHADIPGEESIQRGENQ